MNRKIDESKRAAVASKMENNHSHSNDPRIEPSEAKQVIAVAQKDDRNGDQTYEMNPEASAQILLGLKQASTTIQTFQMDHLPYINNDRSEWCGRSTQSSHDEDKKPAANQSDSIDSKKQCDSSIAGEVLKAISGKNSTFEQNDNEAEQEQEFVKALPSSMNAANSALFGIDKNNNSNQFASFPPRGDILDDQQVPSVATISTILHLKATASKTTFNSFPLRFVPINNPGGESATTIEENTSYAYHDEMTNISSLRIQTFELDVLPYIDQSSGSSRGSSSTETKKKMMKPIEGVEKKSWEELSSRIDANTERLLDLQNMQTRSFSSITAMMGQDLNNNVASTCADSGKQEGFVGNSSQSQPSPFQSNHEKEAELSTRSKSCYTDDEDRPYSKLKNSAEKSHSDYSSITSGKMDVSLTNDGVSSKCTTSDGKMNVSSDGISSPSGSSPSQSNHGLFNSSHESTSNDENDSEKVDNLESNSSGLVSSSSGNNSSTTTTRGKDHRLSNNLSTISNSSPPLSSQKNSNAEDQILHNQLKWLGMTKKGVKDRHYTI